jgi:MFS family permease
MRSSLLNLYRLALSLFLTNLEIPIVTTSLVSITDDLGGFNKVGWVISSYLLGYVGKSSVYIIKFELIREGVLVIFAKLSDILGRRFVLSLSILIFIIFSGACGASQTVDQL